MKRFLFAALLLPALFASVPLATADPGTTTTEKTTSTGDDNQDAVTLKLYTRRRVKDDQDAFQTSYRTVTWQGTRTAVIVCDMWDTHTCPSAARRVAQMAPRLNEVLRAARGTGALIIHAPSGTMDHYADTPERRLAQQAPPSTCDPPLRGWCRLDPKREAPLPIDDSDGGCPDKKLNPPRPWTRQIESIDVLPGDAVTDSAEAIHLMRSRGIDRVILTGVHTNMCVLGRPFGIRQLVSQGFEVVLMRDMTDTMYNPARPPNVSHVRGTELVVEHIEKYWCPTITSCDLLGRPAFRFAEDDRPHVAMLVSDDHYGADKTLPAFAQTLREKHGCHVTVLHGQHSADIPATEELAEVDCLIVFVRRLALPVEQLDRVRAYLAAGKPLVALRTASHAFDVKGNVPPGGAEWPEFDPEILGGHYDGHGSNDAGTDVAVIESEADHPILADQPARSWHSTGSLYFTAPLADDAVVLMTGSIKGRTEPLTWIRTSPRGRTFYSGLGHPDDFQVDAFTELLVQAIFWSIERTR